MAFLVEVSALVTGDRRTESCYDQVYVPVADLLLTRAVLGLVPALVQDRPVKPSLLPNILSRGLYASPLPDSVIDLMCVSS
jgi:hypothetical protein